MSKNKTAPFKLYKEPELPKMGTSKKDASGRMVRSTAPTEEYIGGKKSGKKPITV